MPPMVISASRGCFPRKTAAQTWSSFAPRAFELLQKGVATTHEVELMQIYQQRTIATSLSEEQPAWIQMLEEVYNNDGWTVSHESEVKVYYRHLKGEHLWTFPPLHGVHTCLQPMPIGKKCPALLSACSELVQIACITEMWRRSLGMQYYNHACCMSNLPCASSYKSHVSKLSISPHAWTKVLSQLKSVQSSHCCR